MNKNGFSGGFNQIEFITTQQNPLPTGQERLPVPGGLVVGAAEETTEEASDAEDHLRWPHRLQALQEGRKASVPVPCLKFALDDKLDNFREGYYTQKQITLESSI